MKAVDCTCREWHGLCSSPAEPQHRWQNHNKPARPWILNSKSETQGLQSELDPTAPSTTSHFLKLAVNRGREGPGACQAKQKLVSNSERQNKCSAGSGSQRGAGPAPWSPGEPRRGLAAGSVPRQGGWGQRHPGIKGERGCGAAGGTRGAAAPAGIQRDPGVRTEDPGSAGAAAAGAL